MRIVNISLAALAMGMASPALAADTEVATIEASQPSEERMALALEAVDLLWPEGQGVDMVNFFTGEFANMMLDTPIAELARDFGMEEMVATFAGIEGALKEEGVAEEDMPSADEMKATADFLLAMLGDKTLREMAVGEDEHFNERVTIIRAVLAEELPPIMNAAEPKMRAIMAQMFAKKFSDQELREIGAFADTAAGQKYVDLYWTMGFQPEYYRSIIAAMPEFVKGFPELGKAMEARMAHLPPMFPEPAAETSCETNDEGEEVCVEAAIEPVEDEESYTETPEELDELAAYYEEEAAEYRRQAAERRAAAEAE
ncbi:DUF2059 domain-containing protein [Sphingomicrobium flavum]|uniref:DUF2059 domain-containing protein n=1 Tax=Sphingomicrobium flavum TaxID=1229164 RepID=UPI0021ADCFF4|nr:DUF2059 domain-containing protein [Sphingomicrobium flavum]